jgi:hypothetical protein
MPPVIQLKFRRRAAAFLGAVTFGIACSAISAGDTKDAVISPVISEYQTVIAPILETHCYECHGDGFDKGKVAFDTLDTDEKLLKPDLWLRVLNNTRAGMMPA